MRKNKLPKCAYCSAPNKRHKRAETCKAECQYALRSKRYFEQRGDTPTAPELGAPEEHRIKRENARLRAELAAALEMSERDSRLLQFIESTLEKPLGAVPQWVRIPKSGSRQAMPTMFLSDTHYGENISPEQIEYLNGYGTETALIRTENFFKNGITVARDYLKGLDYPGVVLALGGDLFSGDIHEELDKTNAGPIQVEMLRWIEPMIAGIKMLRDEFGRVFIPSVVGNHPRGTRKPSHKMRVPNNFDWFFVELLAKFLKDEKGIEFRNGRSADVNYTVYETRYRMSHGDQFRGGSGIAGLLSPLMIGDARKRKRAQAANKEYDWLLLAHWHQRLKFKRIYVNGSLKGYDEYAYHGNFDYEHAEQSFWLTDPTKGLTIDAPIFVESADEPWRALIPSRDNLLPRAA